jgi:hypothetical protein
MCPINVKRTDIKQVKKFNNQQRLDFWTSVLTRDTRSANKVRTDKILG